jgi:glyoxylase-like metal-dependent hydrolase (beta-lactamase superfamily II)
MRKVLRNISLFLIASFTAMTHAQSQKSEWTTNISDAQETVVNLGRGIYVLSTNIRPLAGNVTVAVGSDGIIVVDTQFAPLYDRIKAKIAGISALPVRFVIDTHHHGDHSGGNPAFARDGAVIIAQTMAAQHLAHPPDNLDGTPVAPMAPIGMPAITFDKSLLVRVGGQTVQLYHPPLPAHTDDDTIVYFPEANVIATGDVFNSLLYPNIDSRVGGSIDGMIDAVDMVMALANDQTRIVPGHGPVSDISGLAQYHAMLVTARERIAKAKARGMTEQQVTDANLLSDLNPRWYLPGSPVAKDFPALVYRSLK